MDALSKISRGSALLLLLLLGFSALFQIPTTQNLFTDLLVPEKSDIMRDISIGNFENLEKSLSGISGAEPFLIDLKQWKMKESSSIRFFPSGFFLSVQATKGNLFHSYFGFFKTLDGKITEIFWSPPTTGKMEKRTEMNNKKYSLLEFTNTSVFPWSANDEWANAINGGEAILLKNTEPGEKGVFVFPKQEIFVPKNTTHGFVIFEN